MMVHTLQSARLNSKYYYNLWIAQRVLELTVLNSNILICRSSRGIVIALTVETGCQAFIIDFKTL